MNTIMRITVKAKVIDKENFSTTYCPTNGFDWWYKTVTFSDGSWHHMPLWRQCCGGEALFKQKISAKRLHDGTLLFSAHYEAWQGYGGWYGDCASPSLYKYKKFILEIPLDSSITRSVEFSSSHDRFNFDISVSYYYGSEVSTAPRTSLITPKTPKKWTVDVNLLKQKRQKQYLTLCEDTIQNLVFEGGGVKGLAYLGVLKTMASFTDPSPLDLSQIQRVAGASAGALTSLLISLNLPVTSRNQTLPSIEEHLNVDFVALVGEDPTLRNKMLRIRDYLYEGSSINGKKAAEVAGVFISYFFTKGIRLLPSKF